MSPSGLIFLVIWGLLIVGILVLFWHPQRSRTRASTPADRQSTGIIFRDDDRYWRGGFFYNNPDDPAVFVPKRFGLGWVLPLNMVDNSISPLLTSFRLFFVSGQSG